jgi:hypothetical protein
MGWSPHYFCVIMAPFFDCYPYPRGLIARNIILTEEDHEWYLGYLSSKPRIAWELNWREEYRAEFTFLWNGLQVKVLRSLSVLITLQSTTKSRKLEDHSETLTLTKLDFFKLPW